MEIGYIGLGDMGGPLATRLAGEHPLHVFDLDAAAIGRLAAVGATAAESGPQLAERSSIVFLCLPTSQHVESVLFGDRGLAALLRPGSLIIDQTSGDPEVTRRLASRLETQGVLYVDAPVSGGAPAALAGTISIMVGGSPEAFDRAEIALRLISPHVTHIGPVGTGHTMKLINNLISCTQRLLTLEGLALAAKSGIAPDMAVEVLAKGGGRNAYLEQQAGRMLRGDRDRGFSIALALKDLRLAGSIATSAGVPSFFGSVSRDLHRVAVATLGPDTHIEAIAEFVENIADVSLTAD